MINQPKNWQIVKCRDVIDVRDGTHDTPLYVPEGIPLITSKNLTKKGIDFDTAPFISINDHEKIIKRSKVDKGDILFAMIGTIGNPVIVETENDFSIKNVALFKFAKSPVYAKYFLHLLQSEFVKKQLEKETRGGNQKFVSLGMLRNLSIPLPLIDEQKHIAAVLDKADEVRRKRRQAIKKLDELLQSVFLDMFGDPVSNPKGWEVIPLNNLVIKPLQNGAYYPKENYVSENDTNGVEMVHMSDAFGGIVERGKLKKVKITNQDKIKYEITANDLLIARRSLNYEGSAKPCRIPKSNQPLIFESSLIRVSPNQSKVKLLYLYSFLTNERAKQNYVLPFVTKSTISGINQSNLAKVKIIAPSIELQSEFEKLYLTVEKLKLLQMKALETDNLLFQSLQQRAFAGELFGADELAREAQAESLF